MDKKTVLTDYVNKYLKKEYPLINKVEFVYISYNTNDMMNIDFILYSNKEKFSNHFKLNNNFFSAFTIPNTDTISGPLLKYIDVFKSEDLDIDKIKKEIKHYIKLIYSKRINIFLFKLKFE